VFWLDLSSALEELKVPQPIENFWAYLKMKVYINNHRPKDVKYLMAKIRKELKSNETTGIRKTMKEAPVKVLKAHKSGVTFNVTSNLCSV
jgi:hypothetical protein